MGRPPWGTEWEGAGRPRPTRPWSPRGPSGPPPPPPPSPPPASRPGRGVRVRGRPGPMGGRCGPEGPSPSPGGPPLPRCGRLCQSGKERVVGRLGSGARYSRGGVGTRGANSAGGALQERINQEHGYDSKFLRRKKGSAGLLAQSPPPPHKNTHFWQLDVESNMRPPGEDLSSGWSLKSPFGMGSGLLKESSSRAGAIGTEDQV